MAKTVFLAQELEDRACAERIKKALLPVEDGRQAVPGVVVSVVAQDGGPEALRGLVEVLGVQELVSSEGVCVGEGGVQLRGALEPFGRVVTEGREVQGTGLGLPLTKALVEANRARLVLTSEPRKGTLAEVTFPTTRVLAGSQNLQSGTLVLTLVPVRVGQIRWAPESGQR